jgi:rhodanese-related sulfurtransferase
VKITKHSKISQLNFIFPQVVLEENFLWAPDFMQEQHDVSDPDLLDVATISGMDVDKVVLKLRDIKSAESKLVIDADTVLDRYAKGAAIVDVSLKGHASLAGTEILTLSDFRQGDGFEKLAQFSSGIIVIGNSDTRAYSAAMYLRLHGFDQTYLCLGGMSCLSPLLRKRQSGPSTSCSL